VGSKPTPSAILLVIGKLTFKRKQQRISENASKNIAEDNVDDAAFRQLACSTHVCHSYVAGMRQIFPWRAIRLEPRTRGSRRLVQEIATFKMLLISPLDAPHFPRIGHLAYGKLAILVQKSGSIPILT
jgi:hypothetical protein